MSSRADRTVLTRPAHRNDSALLLAWRNDPETIRWSRVPGLTDPTVHKKWLHLSMSMEGRLILIGEDAGGPVGTVRWDRDCSGWEVSITLAPDRRGQRLSGPLLRAGEEALRSRTGAGTPVIAVVHADNAASARLFARAGYADDGTGPDPDGFHTLRRML